MGFQKVPGVVCYVQCAMCFVLCAMFCVPGAVCWHTRYYEILDHFLENIQVLNQKKLLVALQNKSS